MSFPALNAGCMNLPWVLIGLLGGVFCIYVTVLRHSWKNDKMAKDTQACPINKRSEIELIHKMCLKTDNRTVYVNTSPAYSCYFVQNTILQPLSLGKKNDRPPLHSSLKTTDPFTNSTTVNSGFFKEFGPQQFFHFKQFTRTQHLT